MSRPPSDTEADQVPDTPPPNAQSGGRSALDISGAVCAGGADRDPIADMRWALSTAPPDFLSLVSLVQRVGDPVLRVVEEQSQRTPLHIAALYAKVAYSAMLCNRGADLEARDSCQWTPIMSAAFGCTRSPSGSLAVAKLLLSYNVSVDSECEHGSTALHIGTSYGTTEFMELLLSHDANINAVDYLGETPLHKAALRGEADIVGLLLEKGADTDLRAKDGSTALELAIAEDAPELADVIALLQG